MSGDHEGAYLRLILPDCCLPINSFLLQPQLVHHREHFLRMLGDHEGAYLWLISPDCCLPINSFLLQPQLVRTSQRTLSENVRRSWRGIFAVDLAWLLFAHQLFPPSASPCTSQRTLSQLYRSVMVRYHHKCMQVLVWSVCSFFSDFHPNQNVWANFNNCIINKIAFLTYYLWLHVAEMHVGTIRSSRECCRIQEYNTQYKGTILLEPRMFAAGNGSVGGTVEIC